MAKRRDPWAENPSTQGATSPDSMSIFASSNIETNEGNAAFTTLDLIPAPQERKKRDRSWEQKHVSSVATYRGIPGEIHEAVVGLAEELQVITGEIVRAFLEYGIMCFQRGDFELRPNFNGTRLTLFGDSSWQEVTGWSEAQWSQSRRVIPKRRRKDASQPRAWKSVVSYRGVPENVQENVRELSRWKDIPVGEVVTALLGHSMNAYAEGRLVLHPQPRPQPRTQSFTLTGIDAQEGSGQ